MITRLHVQGFKSLKDLDLELRPLNVMIGPNGGGKSNVVDVFEFLRLGAGGKLKDALEIRGRGLFWAREEMPLSITVSVLGGSDTTRARRYTYGLELEHPDFADPFDNLSGIAREILSVEGRSEPIMARGPGWPWRAEGKDIERPVASGLNEDELLLAQWTNPYAFGPVRSELQLPCTYGNLDTSPRADVRVPQPLRAELRVDPSGDNLVSVLHYAANTEARATTFLPVEETLRSAFPDLEDLRFPPEGGEGYIGLRWHQKGFRRGFTPAQLSDGTLRFLWLLTIVQQPPTGGLIMIEEPEVGLHPDLIRLFAESLKAVASEEKQFLIATHSPELVSWLEPEDVLVVDKDEEGATQARRLDREALGKWLESYTLGELWRMGEVGGRAW